MLTGAIARFNLVSEKAASPQQQCGKPLAYRSSYLLFILRLSLRMKYFGGACRKGEAFPTVRRQSRKNLPHSKHNPPVPFPAGDSLPIQVLQ